MKKKITAIFLCVALLATAIVGASLAYFTDTDNETNTFTVGNVKIGSSGFSLGFRQSTASFDNGTFISFWVFCIFILIYKVFPSGALTIFPHVNDRTSLRRSPVKQENRNARLTSSWGQGAAIAAFISSNVRYSLMLSVG